MSYMECRHIKSNGCKCQAPSLRDKAYCYVHMRLHRALHRYKALSSPAPGAVPAAESDLPLDVPAVEDRAAVQLALTQVLQGLGSKTIDLQRAGRLLYGIQIAAQLVERPSSIFSGDYARNVTIDSEGDELGPATYECEEDNCNKCPYSTKDQCQDWHYLDKKDGKNDKKNDDDDDD
jgi:hypothetical protein